MKKIGVITFHRAINYGALLQAFALIKTLQALGKEAFLIDYRSPCIESRHTPMHLSLHPLSIYRFIRYAKTVNARYRNFRNFLDTIPHTDPCLSNRDLTEISKNLDAVICGSDQIWNTQITQNDYNYYLEFGNNLNRIAYAASFGITHIPTNAKQIIKRALSKFNHISVREEAGARIVENLISEKPPVVLDPTLLLTADDWRSVSRPIKLPEHYILVYSVGEIGALIPIANKVSERVKLPIVVFSHRQLSGLSKPFYLKETGPEGFLDAFDKADYVITNSFHGTAFSVIFRKKFIVVPRTTDPSKGSGINSRMETLLRKTSLDSQFYHNGDAVKQMEDVNYAVAEKKISELRDFSIKFLTTALS